MDIKFLYTLIINKKFANVVLFNRFIFLKTSSYIFFTLGMSDKSQGAKSGLFEGWSITQLKPNSNFCSLRSHVDIVKASFFGKLNQEFDNYLYDFTGR